MADVGNWAELVGCPMETPAPLGPPGEGLDSAMVSLHTDVPEALLTAMRGFIERHPNWDQYRLIQAALAGFLAAAGFAEPRSHPLLPGQSFSGSGRIPRRLKQCTPKTWR
jgi:hypothetical protein